MPLTKSEIVERLMLVIGCHKPVRDCESCRGYLLAITDQLKDEIKSAPGAKATDWWSELNPVIIRLGGQPGEHFKTVLIRAAERLEQLEGSQHKPGGSDAQ